MISAQDRAPFARPSENAAQYRSQLAILLSLALLAQLGGGCANGTPVRRLVLPAPPGEVLRARLGSIAVVSGQFVPEVRIVAPAKGGGEGAGRGAGTGGAGPLAIAAQAPGAGYPPGYAVIGALLLAPVTATAGAVAGALMARPAAEVEAEEKQFASALAQRDTQACLRKQVAAYASDWTGNTVPVIPERGPKTAAGGADYSDLDAARELTILEVVVETLAIDGWGIRSPRTTLFVVARTRLLRARDGAELYGSRIGFHSRERPWRQWTPTGLADELDRACDLLAERISDEIFALYVPAIWQQR